MRPPVILTQHASDPRHGQQQILEALPEVTVIGTQASAREVAALSRTARWDIVVLDCTGPADNGIEAISQLRRDRPDLRLIMLARTLDPDYIRFCLGLGLRGYLAAQDGQHETGRAVRAVLAGAVYLSRSAAQALLAGGG